MNTKSKPRLGIVRTLLICLLAIAVTLAASGYLPPGRDWGGNYRLASLPLLSGKSPYSVDAFFAPPSSLIPLLPFALLPENIGRAALFLVSIIAFAFTAHRLGAKPPAIIAFLLSPPLIHCLLNANIEWLPLLGFILPPQLGLLLVTTKPQTGPIVALFWIAEAWRKGGLREVVRISWLISLVVLISFALFGLWPMRFRDILPLARNINASLWPVSIPVGLVLLTASIRKRELRYAMGASPCLSPYLLFHGWTGALASIASSTTEMIAAVIGLWILVAIRAFTGTL
jgi:hypothetical protein